ncbi:trigger factor [Candidatus Saccharibacteria bacterium]|jgi:trigger factor|nr:MAG: trigger factor [Candidatus Saccharibacteria bacterium]HMU11900.1 trigger factor [Candidatus Nanoperiomorbaceae bacterium]
MKHTRKDVSESKIEYQITVAAEDVAKHHRAAVSKLARDVKVAGFRAGHVPPEVAEKHIDPSALADESVNRAINGALVELIELDQIQLLDQPDISVTKFVPGQTLEFKATVEIVPPVKLADPAKLKTKKSAVKIDADEVDEVINRIRNDAAEKVTIKRAAESGDEAIINFDGKDKDGKSIEGAKGDDYALKLGSNSFIPGFEEGIVGHKAGDIFDLPLVFPKDYGAKHLAGAKVNFHIEVKEIKEIKLPELDDTFAASIAPDFKTVDDLKKDIRSELETRAAYDVEQKFKDDLLDELTEKSKVPTPEILVTDQLTSLERNFAQNLMYRGMTVEQYLEGENLTHDEWTKKELRPAAEKRVRNSLVMAQLTRDWDVTVSEDEVVAQQAKVVAQYNDPSLRQRFESDEAKRQLAQQLIADKTLTKLAELNSK